MAGLFDTFNISLRGLNVQQSNINTAAHNVANASTEGYSRQRSVAHTTRPFGGTSKWDVCTAGQVGTGAEIVAIQRIRNTFLDYQVREKISDAGTSDIKYNYLYQAESILSDSSNTGIQSALNKFFNAFQDITTSSDKNSSKKTALSQADSLATVISSKYTQLENKKLQMQQELENYVVDINKKLDQVKELNKQIASVAVVGMSANDLMDERDLLLDELSSKYGINVDRDQYDTINLKMSEDDFTTKVKKQVTQVNAGGTTTTSMQDVTVDKLVSSDSDESCLRFSYIKEVKAADDGSSVTVTYSKLGKSGSEKSFTITGLGNDQDKINEVVNYFSEQRVLLTDQEGVLKSSDGKIIGDEISVTYTNYKDNLKKQTFGDGTITKGQIAGNLQAQKDIQAAMDELDVMAASLAYTVNAVHTGVINGETPVTTDLIFVKSGTTTDNGINAKNISLNQVIYNDPTKLICGVDKDAGEKDSSRAQAIADIASLKLDYAKVSKLTQNNDTRKEFLTSIGITAFTTTDTANNQKLPTYKDGSTVKDYYNSITTGLGTKVETAKKNNTTNTAELQQYEEQRQVESGVSLDEEMTDMIVFQRAYQANAKVMNTVDQLLEVVINGLKA